VPASDIHDGGATCRLQPSAKFAIDATDRSLIAPKEVWMSKGETTRQRIVARSADLLNAQGYRSTPVSEIMRVAGLQKGGIYRHFESRSALALEAFEFAFGRLRDRFLAAIDGKRTASEKLFGLFDVIRNAPYEDALRGGCPAMNLAIESDDADPEMRDAARNAMARLMGLFERVVAEGMAAGEFARGDAKAQASVIVASIEGAIMLSNLHKDRAHIDAVLAHLERRVEAGFR
jgi:TetR/AcrR family transcriptional repressor of nem operon